MFRTLILLCITMPSHAEVYKWVDDAGNVHYGDKPSAGVSADEVDIKSSVVGSGIDESRAEHRERLLDAMQEDREALAEKRRKQEKQRLARMEKCKGIKRKYQRMKDANNVYKRKKDGGKNYLSFEDRAALEAKYRKRINKYCR